MERKHDKNIAVMIADDDDIMRDLLSSHLQSFDGVQVLASLSSSNCVLEEAIRLKPTLIFLDICMPDETGLNLASRLREALPDTYLVFVSDHTEYAAQAFALEAADYLVKPIGREHIARALQRVKKHLGLCGQWHKNSLGKVLTVWEGHQLFLIHPQDIYYIEKQGRKTIIHTGMRRYLTGETLQSLSARLGSEFFRCHKSFIINIKQIEMICPVGDRVYSVGFYHYPGDVTMGRQAYEKLCTRLTTKKP